MPDADDPGRLKGSGWPSGCPAQKSANQSSALKKAGRSMCFVSWKDATADTLRFGPPRLLRPPPEKSPFASL